MSQPPYPYGVPQDPAYPPPADPYQPSYPPAYQEPGYPSQAAYPPTQPYPANPYQPSTPTYQPSGPPQYPAYPDPAYPGGPGYPGGYGYPQPVPPKRGGAGVVIAVVVVLLVLVVGGGITAAVLLSKPDKPIASGSTGPDSHTSSSPSVTPSPSVGPTHGGDLRSYLVAMPGGARKCAKQEGTDENLSLDEAANLSDNPDARKQTLQDYHFTKGAARCWIMPDKTVVDLRLYQFDSADNARGFFGDDVDATSSGYDSSNITDVNGVPGGKTFADLKPNSDGYVSVISIGNKGDVVLVVAILAEPQATNVSLCDQLLVSEYQKL